jgi:hypothetical protein
MFNGNATGKVIDKEKLKFVKMRKMKRLENGNVEDRPHFIVSITVNFLVSDSAPKQFDDQWG